MVTPSSLGSLTRRRTISLNSRWITSAIRFWRLSDKLSNPFPSVGLDHVSLLKGGKTVDRNAALETGTHFGNVFLKALQGSHGSIVQLFVPTQYQGPRIALDGAAGHITACNLPISADAVEGPELAEGAMEVYAHVGEYDLALELLEILLSGSSNISVPLVRVDPLWDPMREDPRFVRLVEEYGDN